MSNACDLPAGHHVDKLDAPLDGVVVLVASQAGNVEEDAAEGVGDPGLGLLQAVDKLPVAGARRPGVGSEIAQPVLAVAGRQVLARRFQAQIMASERRGARR